MTRVRMALINAAVLGLLIGIAYTGVLNRFLVEDTTFLTHAITTLGMLAIGMQLGYAIVGREPGPLLDYVPNALVFLGLIGTMIGVKMAFAALGTAELGSNASVMAVVPVIGQGLAIAVNTTIAGSVMALWVEVNFRLLEAVHGPSLRA